jgi:hypothetical protein
MRATNCAETTVLSDGAGRRATMGVRGGGDTEEENADQAGQDKRVLPHASLLNLLHTPPRTIKEPPELVNTFQLQMNKSRNK